MTLTLKSAALLALATPAAVLLAGCGMASVAPVAPTAFAGNSIKGHFMGGQQPVAGVAVQLYATGNTGYGSASTPLLTPGAVVSDANGVFTFGTNASNGYTCPAQDSLVYLVGLGGQPIAAANGQPAVTNPNLGLMTAIGRCGDINASTFLVVNELTTVAAVYALNPFMSSVTAVGTSATNQLGLKNAFNTVNKLVNSGNGSAPGPLLVASTVFPLAELNTLADIIEQCVNSSGGTASDTSTGCGNLFSLTSGPTTPTETITAALNIARNPGRNVAALNTLPSAKPAFQPTLGNTPPNDWTLAINYFGGNMNTPASLALDQTGAVWIANNGNSTVSKLDATGTFVSGQGGYTAGGISVPAGIAIDQGGNAWVSNTGNSSITKLDPTGATGLGISGNGLVVPQGIAIDAAGNVYVGNAPPSFFGVTGGVSSFTNAGAAITNTTAGGLDSPSSIAISNK